MNRRFSIPILFSFIILGFGCNQGKQHRPKHPKLLGAQSVYVGEPMDPEAAKYVQLANSDNVKIEKREHYMIVTAWYIANACGKSIPDLNFKNDTINLTYNETSEELCMSVSIEEITYFVDNRDDKNWKIIKTNSYPFSW
ncbi:hypothetical protein [Flagellimonas onchidii]|uniref:hypothetical protein n=1 Tax=Flagellimonas onchidii TaxID=2562684 RepID=UPI0010A68200|nr:hypothetical protein [Allomuricauda onchidii]